MNGAEFHILIADPTGEHISTQRLVVDISDEERGRHLEEVRGAWRGIMAEAFPAKPTILCGYCSYQKRCKEKGR